MENSKQYALITGATSGIGYELAKLFAKDQYNLVIVARHEADLKKAASEFRKEGVKVETITKDLFKKEAASEIYEEVKNRGITINVLVNNAGQGEFGKFIENNLQDELEIIQLNIVATVALTKYFIRDMMQAGEGKILNLSSIAGKVPGPYQAVYHGTKAFIQFFTEAVRSEMKDTGISLTALLPGATDTDFFNKADMESSKILEQDLADPAKAAEDGYKALMNGEAMVISGFKNKMQVAMGNMMPDNKSADMMGKQQKPKEEEHQSK
ncbi:SDR family oxidoreductase [Marivirga sp. S37H4]|uniref:SDR family oxidoreductase n=1 Tax=Marivirga aurantiaca TaxID=2802615 RepID=A0A934WW99_9BACT|nr:SDR family oxidoreductase [Marivirga aurantiaca]MBK6264061.1 SDR family oxidoreductase [Marivirga aurantiaca]